MELLKKFERYLFYLSKQERQLLDPSKVEFFLQAADGELEEKLTFFFKIKKKKKDEKKLKESGQGNIFFLYKEKEESTR